MTTPVAVVTGGSRGIGRAFVLECARRDLAVVLTHRGRGTDAEETVRAVEELGGRAVAVVADVTTDEGVAAVVTAAAGLGTVQVLVNNAGILAHGELDETTDELWDAAFAIHVKAPMKLTRALRDDLASSRGAVLNLSSTGGVVGSVHGVSYGASKSAVIGLTKTLARELAPHVRVNAVAPGPVATDMYSSIPADEQEAVENETPLRRIADPSEIARTGLDIASWPNVTGQVIVSDGGRVM